MIILVSLQVYMSLIS